METAAVSMALIVDDNPIVLMHAAEILEEAGFATITALSAEDAIQTLEKHGEAITLLFTDVEMPGILNGFELACMTAERWPDVGIIVASGDRTPVDGDLPEGAIFIGKPFSAEIVHGHVHQVLPDEKKPEPLKNMP